MLTLDIKILEFKRLFPLLCSARFWGQPGELSIFVLCFPLTHMNKFTFSFNYSGSRIYFCHRSEHKLPD